MHLPHTPPHQLAHCRVRLSKRRAKAGVQSGTNALLVVKHPLIIFHQAAQLLSQLRTRFCWGVGLVRYITAVWSAGPERPSTPHD